MNELRRYYESEYSRAMRLGSLWTALREAEPPGSRQELYEQISQNCTKELRTVQRFYQDVRIGRYKIKEIQESGMDPASLEMLLALYSTRSLCDTYTGSDHYSCDLYFSVGNTLLLKNCIILYLFLYMYDIYTTFQQDSGEVSRKNIIHLRFPNTLDFELFEENGMEALMALLGKFPELHTQAVIDIYTVSA